MTTSRWCIHGKDNGACIICNSSPVAPSPASGSDVGKRLRDHAAHPVAAYSGSYEIDTALVLEAAALIARLEAENKELRTALKDIETDANVWRGEYCTHETPAVIVGCFKAFEDYARKALSPTEDQIKHMVQRFLGWKLPQDFHPDCGIHFDADEAIKMHPKNARYEPVGTNLLSAQQATAMVRHMIEGLPKSHGETEQESET